MVDGRTLHVYEAMEPRSGVSAAKAVHLFDLVCNGSVQEVLVGMVDTVMLYCKRLRMLTDRITQTKSGKK